MVLFRLWIFLTQQTKSLHGQTVENQVFAKDKNVIVIGGGDTGSDCVGTSVMTRCSICY